MNRNGFVPIVGGLVGNRPDVVDQLAETHIYDDESEQRRMHDDRMGMMRQGLNQ